MYVLLWVASLPRSFLHVIVSARRGSTLSIVLAVWYSLASLGGVVYFYMEREERFGLPDHASFLLQVGDFRRVGKQTTTSGSIALRGGILA